MSALAARWGRSRRPAAWTAALLACGAVQGCAGLAGPKPPVCGDPQVLGEVDQIMRARGRPLTFESPPVGEISTDPTLRGPPLAHCSVRAHTFGYDTNRYGMTPLYAPFIVNYTIELRQNGMFVRVD